MQVKIIINKVAGHTLNIDQGNFSGDLEKARKAIQSFVDKNTFTYKSHGHGYGTLTVNGKDHHINPYGVDISMMFEFCGIDESEFTSTRQLSFG